MPIDASNAHETLNESCTIEGGDFSHVDSGQGDHGFAALPTEIARRSRAPATLTITSTSLYELTLKAGSQNIAPTTIFSNIREENLVVGDTSLKSCHEAEFRVREVSASFACARFVDDL